VISASFAAMGRWFYYWRRGSAPAGSSAAQFMPLPARTSLFAGTVNVTRRGAGRGAALLQAERLSGMATGGGGRCAATRRGAGNIAAPRGGAVRRGA